MDYHATVPQQPTVIILMGVAGAGKTTVGRRLAAEMGWAFYDADDFHPAENIAKMARGEPLTDADRLPWLERMHDLIHDALQRGESAVVACSALKASYRAILARQNPGVRFIYLKASPELIRRRLLERPGHFMRAEMLESQFAALEEPADALVVAAAQPVEQIVKEIITRGLGGPRSQWFS
ncbi:MAG: gluconokinase [Armatimonadota bacterium]